jgi:hypothetical protein
MSKPLAKLARMLTQSQMELTLSEKTKKIADARRARRIRAQWWFAQMHRAVDQALDWRPRPRGQSGTQIRLVMEG